MSTIEKIITEDGSHTLFHSGIGEHYHSIHGAIQESVHVFIQQGFVATADRFHEVRLLEVGFGTGLNALLTLEIATRMGIHVFYQSFEPFPLSPDFVEDLNYTDNEQLKSFSADFQAMHHANDGEVVRINEWFSFQRMEDKIQLGITDAYLFNLIYFDAFSPVVAPELWQPEIFTLMRQHMVEKGILVTYCARGAVRRALQAAGFRVERLPGPPGKREMLRANAI
ncbi:MAG: tRNA (5-methylaminomethyl-2-thiouridine)(34)-methyltransferase MnmD [Lentimicrobium sp.]|jgi:tRNA U34 5-methylaminomethyl-2-thiouridine-forming methyltransferase MnmC|nr:tRNA (5-methylaminomethyl-2-thiouridine)(34)-methyltransferase MnmD [Lentimicrobium sp.]